MTVSELTFILKDSGVSLLIYGAEFADAVKELSNKADEETGIGLWLEKVTLAQRKELVTVRGNWHASKFQNTSNLLTKSLEIQQEKY